MDDAVCMSFEPSEDPDALSAHVAGAARVLIYDAGCLHYSGHGEGREDEIFGKEPVLMVAGSVAVSQLIDRLHVSRVIDGYCMCAGTVSLEFLNATGGRITVAAIHHGKRLRWSGWSGDAELADGPRLLALLSELGYDGPLDDAKRAEALRLEALAIRDAWSAAAPECVRSLVPEMFSNGSLYDAGIVAQVDALLTAEFPDTLERCRIALAWFAAGTGLCSGYPMHEEIPGKVLAKLPISVLVEALAGEPPTGAVWAGALRHIAGWRTRSKGELLQAPPAIWDTLLDVAQRGNDADKLARIERKVAEYRTEW